MGQRCAIVGTSLDVCEIVEVAKDNGLSVPETAACLEIDSRLVESALRYYGANREEIDDWIARVHALSEA
jgi:ABC-type phosphonate transport system ATPase subunit